MAYKKGLKTNENKKERMKRMTRGQQVYWDQRNDLDIDAGSDYISSFSTLMGLQAVHIGNMIQSKRRNNMGSVLHHWTQLVKLNDKWVCLVMSPFHRTPGVNEERLERLRRVASDMSQGYTSTIAELIINGSVPTKKLENVIGAEARFFSVVLGTPRAHATSLAASLSSSPSNIENETRRHWCDHTASILDLMRSASQGEMYDDDTYHHAAANCIIHGKLLGSYLDAVFLGK